MLAQTPGIRWLGEIQRDLLPDLCQNAIAFLFPSLYEGFGLPPLEAMASGTPVMCSNRASLPEVVGNAALLIDPENNGAMSDAMQRLVDDATLRKDLSAKGLAQAARVFLAYVHDGENPTPVRTMPVMKTSCRIALVHDWLTGMRGGEKVLEVLCELFPKADLFTLVHVPGKVSPIIESHRIITSPLQKFPNVGAYYRDLLPLMPWAMNQLDFSIYNLVISTSHCVAKAAKPAGGAQHVCYCHTPMRYIWDQYDSYFGPGTRFMARAYGMMKIIRPALQRWDVATVPRVQRFIANSKNVRERIQRLYHRDADVIYPPADVNFYSASPGLRATLSRREKGLGVEAMIPYLIVSALAPYKRVDVALEAFGRLGKRN